MQLTTPLNEANNRIGQTARILISSGETILLSTALSSETSEIFADAALIISLSANQSPSNRK